MEGCEVGEEKKEGQLNKRSYYYAFVGNNNTINNDSCVI